MFRIFERAVSRLLRPSLAAGFLFVLSGIDVAGVGVTGHGVTGIGGTFVGQILSGPAGVAHAQQAAPAEPAKAPAKPDIAKGEKIASEVCVACHAIDGNATAPANPKLAGQHPAYLAKQLANFKPAPGKDKAERENAVMAAFSATLSEADMRNVAAYYASQQLKPSAASKAEYAELGQTIFRSGIADKGVPACASCHGPAGKGIPSQYPHVAGQWADYHVSQLKAFQAGTRANYAPMSTIALRLTDREVQAVSDYMAGLR